MKFLFLPAIFLVTLIVSANTQSFPVIPNTFSLDLEVNELEFNRTVIFTQNYDSANQQVKFTEYQHDKVVENYYFIPQVSF